MYIYQRSKWPNFTWDERRVAALLVELKFQQGKLLGKMEHLGFDLQNQASLDTLTSEVIKSSEIEGEHLDGEQVRSSIARHLGLEVAGALPVDRHVDGIVEMLLDATQNFNQSLTVKRLKHWHAALFPAGMSGMMLIMPGEWRSDAQGPMQVVSGSYGKPKVHFQAPSAECLEGEMLRFINWFNEKPTYDYFIKSAIAHLWFVTLHPFEDGNGRMARAISDMALARADNQSNRFYSMSVQIRKERKEYYEQLECAQKGGLDITKWLLWFLNCLQRAIVNSDSVLEYVLNKTKFWEQHALKSFNERQVFMLNKLFDGFKGNLTTSKWAKLTKCSQDTATRDIKKLCELDILEKASSSGRSTHYLLKDFPIRSL